MNVMFVLMDDFRLQMGGDAAFRVGGAATTEMHTPSLDSLRESSVFFPKAQVQIALCGPSRASMLTGRRPDTNKVWDLHSYWRIAGPANATSMPQHFRNMGYITHSVGKIYHPGTSSGALPPDTDPNYNACLPSAHQIIIHAAS